MTNHRMPLKKVVVSFYFSEYQSMNYENRTIWMVTYNKKDSCSTKSYLCSINEHRSSPMLNILRLWWWRKSRMFHKIPPFNHAFILPRIRHLSWRKEAGGIIRNIIFIKVFLQRENKSMKKRVWCFMHATNSSIPI